MLVKEINEITSQFRQATGFPAPTDGRLTFHKDNTLTVQSLWSQRDIERSEKTTLQRTHVIDIANGNVLSQTGPQEVNNELWNKTSPSGNLRVVVRSGKDKKNEDKQYLEIYDKTKKLKTLDVLALEKHGKIVNDDGQFGCLEWSASEKHLLYIAEKKRPKTGSFFETKKLKGDGDSEEVQKGYEHEYYESWGEQLTERHHSVICVMEVETTNVNVIENVENHLSSGQAIWSPDDVGVVFCAWDHEPYRLGIKHCCQRKSGLYYLDIKQGSIERLSPDGRAVRFPRFSPDGSRLTYLDTPVGGAHLQCARLIMIDWVTRKSKVVVDVVRYAPASSFQGIYTALLPKKVWLGDSIHLVLSTAWRSVTAVVVVNTDTGTVTRLSKDANQSSLSLLGVENTTILMSCSSITTPFHLVLAHFKDLSNLNSIQWIYPDKVPDALEWLSWRVIQHTPTADRRSALNSNLDYESILCLPSGSKDDGSLPPLIVHPHGGPHVFSDISYNGITDFLCRCGFAVLMVNYRGSLGFGEDGVESLLGNVGDQDVKDVEAAMASVIAKGLVDEKRLLAFGGSHGGFLAAHLISQYPKTFKAASVRNAVLNLTSLLSTTDIPDWTFDEGGFPFDISTLMDYQTFPGLWKRSPISYVDQMTTPILLMVGMEDKRVPSSQSFEYYKALKTRHTPVRCLTYASNHSLSEVDVEGDCMVNTVLWFNTYL